MVTGDAVIVGYDGSGCADAALEVAARQSVRCGGAPVVVVHCYEAPGPYSTPVGLEPAAYVGSWAEEQQTAAREAADAVVSGAVSKLAELGVVADGVAREGEPSAALVEEAVERGAAMIVVGTHGEGALAGALLGSTAYRLVHRSPVPVLIVPPAERRR